MENELRKQICIEVDAKNIDGKTASRLLSILNNDKTIVLYAIDCDPELLIEKFVNSQSDACSLFAEDVDRLIEDWKRFCRNENIIKSPFYKLK